MQELFVFFQDRTAFIGYVEMSIFATQSQPCLIGENRIVLWAFPLRLRFIDKNLSITDPPSCTAPNARFELEFARGNRRIEFRICLIGEATANNHSVDQT